MLRKSILGKKIARKRYEKLFSLQESVLASAHPPTVFPASHFCVPFLQFFRIISCFLWARRPSPTVLINPTSCSKNGTYFRYCYKRYENQLETSLKKKLFWTKCLTYNESSSSPSSSSSSDSCPFELKIQKKIGIFANKISDFVTRS